ncbi:dissimilatory reductase [Candidatus Thiomargarita nelsonii]|uniref:Dissimilatory reductase n=1 Tax=Candidatus Thiomargarita nelsonii TaxID=1003181 RepID=A0A176S7G8_9GAMM|nr:dissimilatory reductase [Candidatus Thiomargarita nelsonii]
MSLPTANASPTTRRICLIPPTVKRPISTTFLTKDGRYLTIAAYDDNKLVVIDFKTKKVVKDIPAGCTPHTGSGAITNNGKYLYVSAGYAGNKVVIYDSQTLKKVKEVSLEVPAGIFSHARPKMVTIGLE